jgi:hypothetical protein
MIGKNADWEVVAELPVFFVPRVLGGAVCSFWIGRRELVKTIPSMGDHRVLVDA